MADSPFNTLESDSDLNEALSHSEDEPVLLFKHSSICPISSRAHTEMEQLAGENGLPIYKVTVQSARSVSDRIAEEMNVRHESPQAILVSEGQPTFDASHGDVNAPTIREVIH